MTALAAVAANAFCAPAVLAEICMYRDEQGNVTYSNVSAAPPRDAEKIRCFREAKPAASPGGSAQTARPAAESFPSVDRDTQRRRDAERRRILESELEAEQQRLEQARQQLDEQESVRFGDERNYQRYLDRVQPFRDRVENHERNVQALQRELDGLR